MWMLTYAEIAKMRARWFAVHAWTQAWGLRMRGRVSLAKCMMEHAGKSKDACARVCSTCKEPSMRVTYAWSRIACEVHDGACGCVQSGHAPLAVAPRQVRANAYSSSRCAPCSARAVPVQCPYSARTVPVVKTYTFAHSAFAGKK